jgi:hypothetical protein
VDVAALQAELAAAHAALEESQAQILSVQEQGQQMLAAAMALMEKGATVSAAPATKHDVEPAADDPRRNVPEEGFEPVKFRSKGVNHRIVRVAATRWTTLNGEAQHAGGISYDFAPGRGEFVALNSDVAEFLRARPAFNREFWEVGAEPHAAPDPSIVLDKVQQALFDLDLDALAELKALEQASHRRKVVLDQINSAERRIAQAGQ